MKGMAVELATLKSILDSIVSRLKCTDGSIP